MNPISLVVLAGLGFLVFFWLKTLKPATRTRAVIAIILVIASTFVLLMALTGRLHWIAAVAAGLLPFARRLFPLFIRFLPFLNYLYKKRQSQASSGNVSKVETKILSMRLDHDSGVMYGTVKQGPLQGKELGDLSEQEFMQLLQYCREHDGESTRLLTTYLDKRFGDSWREDDIPHNDSSNNHSHQGTMSRREAFDILGISPNSNKEEIIAAHRKLMQKMHPDRGGSDYLAAQINQAKDVLIND